MRRISKGGRLCCGFVCAALALPVFGQSPPAADAAPPAAPPASAPAHPRHALRSVSLDDRVRGLSRALDLDTAQQQQLKAVLENERKEIRGLAANPSIRTEDRIGAVRAINDATVERIRALLNDEQKKNYYPAGPPAAPGTSGNGDLDYWLHALVRPPAKQQ